MAHGVVTVFSKTGEVCKDINVRVFCKNVENCDYSFYQF
jgi:hypothetical protein